MMNSQAPHNKIPTSSGIKECRYISLNGCYQKPEIIFFPISNNILNENCSDMASGKEVAGGCTGLTLCYCVSVNIIGAG